MRCSIDRDLLGHELPNFRQQLARTVGFRHIVIAASQAAVCALALKF
jgi:hypothetical protein